MNKEGGLNEEEKENDFIFANEEQKEEEKKDYSLNDEDRARMEQVRAMHGPIPDNIIEQKLIRMIQNIEEKVLGVQTRSEDLADKDSLEQKFNTIDQKI